MFSKVFNRIQKTLSFLSLTDKQSAISIPRLLTVLVSGLALSQPASFITLGFLFVALTAYFVQEWIDHKTIKLEEDQLAKYEQAIALQQEQLIKLKDQVSKLEISGLRRN